MSKVIGPDYVKLLVEEYDVKERALVSKFTITTTEKARINSLIRDIREYFIDKHIWIKPLHASFPKVNAKTYFIKNHDNLIFNAPDEKHPVYYKISFFNPLNDSLKFNENRIALRAAKDYISMWCYLFDKHPGSEKEMSFDSFYYMNENSGYSVCDNTNGDCFCEDFKTEIDAKRYLDGWSMEEIEFGER